MPAIFQQSSTSGGNSRRTCVLMIGFLIIAFVPYFLVLFSCFSLFVRLLLQSGCLWNAYYCVACSTTYYVLKKRLDANYPSQQARIMKLKNIPIVPHPALEVKTFCWVELVGSNDDTDSDEPKATGTNGATVLAEHLAEKDTSESQSTEEVIRDLRAWSLEHPCVIVGPEEDVKIGDVLTVHLHEGDPSKPYFRPYQKQTQRRMILLFFRGVLQFCLCLLALRFIFGGFPLFFADSQDLEDAMNNFWDTAIDDMVNALVDAFPSLADDDDGDDDTDSDSPVCRIPLYVSLSYDALILLQIGFMVVVPINFYRRTKQLYGYEEPGADSYQLLRGDEDQDELNARNESTKPQTLNGDAVFL